MFKTIIKESIIMILLLVAIVLGLGVLLYDYIPTNKIVPIISKYETSDNIKEELEEKISNESHEVIVTYEVDAKDLNIYEKNKQYNAGNPNPFSYYNNIEDNKSNNTAENNNTEKNNTTGNNTTTNSSNTNTSKDDGTFFKNNGTK